MSRFTRFSRGKIWFVDIGPCKRFDIFQLCKNPNDNRSSVCCSSSQLSAERRQSFLKFRICCVFSPKELTLFLQIPEVLKKPRGRFKFSSVTRACNKLPWGRSKLARGNAVDSPLHWISLFQGSGFLSAGANSTLRKSLLRQALVLCSWECSEYRPN